MRTGEKVQVEVPVHLEGESFSGTIATQDAATVLLEVEATNIPERIVLSIEGLEEGTLVHAKELELPKGATLLSEEDMVVVGITVPVADTDDEAPAEGEGEEESVTPEPEAE